MLTSISIQNKPEKDFFKSIVANAKFNSLQQVLNVRVGINNFANFSFICKSSLLMRDVVLNSPYVSAWARSTQVLNDTDSKYSIYRSAIDENDSYNLKLITQMEDLFKDNHTQDNIRCLVPLNSLTEYAFTCDIMTLVYMSFMLEKIVNSQSSLKPEAEVFFDYLLEVFDSYNISLNDLRASYTDQLKYQFQSIGSNDKSLSLLTGLESYYLNTTYSVVGQLFRHRTLYKKFQHNSLSTQSNNYIENLLIDSKHLTSIEDYREIDLHPEVSELIKSNTKNANNIYQLLQGSIIPIELNGTPESIRKMLSQRSCCINDTAHFKHIFIDFKNRHPNSSIYPPCKNNVKKFGCYVGYVNESRVKGEEKTQVPCPIWSDIHLPEALAKQSRNNKKFEWYYNSLTSWKAWKNKIELS